ncbi:MAG: aminopeptidase P family N-terminal domain-containing protein, partial [Pseudomonadota bacterium]
MSSSPASPASSSPIPQRLVALRAHMAQQGWHACLVPSSDPHLSEYLPLRWQTREWLSGFTGSSGTLIVAAHQAALFTDSRYWEQAEAELADSGIALFKLEGPAVPAYADWLKALQLTAAQPTLAVDGTVMGLAQTQALREALTVAGWTLTTQQDPVDAIWTDRPAPPLVP